MTASSDRMWTPERHPLGRPPVGDGGVAAVSCVFCEIVAGRAPATVVKRWPDAIAILPRSRGVTAGHTLVIPRAHVSDATVDPIVTGAVAARAAELAVPACNIITSAGSAASQTVGHLHLHVVPRRDGDGLTLPWTPRATEPAGNPGGAIS